MTQAAAKHAVAEEPIYVTMCLAGQMFGIEVKHVRDVLLQQKVTPIPLAPPEVAGSLNLRGRIVTVINLRERLKLPPREEGQKNSFVVVEFKGELYSLMVDSVSEVITAEPAQIEKTPSNLNDCWRDIASGIYKREDELLVLVDIQTLLQINV